MGGDFGLVVVAVDEYAELEPLPSTSTAGRLADLLAPYGASTSAVRPPTTAQAVRAHLHGWAAADEGPASSFIYWVGHGESDGDRQWLLASESTQPYSTANAVAATELADFLITRWVNRVAADEAAWTVVVLDCCNSEVGTNNVLHALTARAEREPNRLALVVVASGASTVGRFVTELAAALGARSEYDHRIDLHGLLWEVTRRLGEGLKPILWLPIEAALVNPHRVEHMGPMNVDLLDEWRRVVQELPPEVRVHFLAKAQSADRSDLAWHFCGRRAETRRLARWLRQQRSGLMVVTGEPGAGKSALLGQMVTLADERVTAVLAAAGLLEDRGADERPSSGVFDVVVHLTGKTSLDLLAPLAALAGSSAPAADAPAVLGGLRALARPVTVLVDALDEAQEPELIARTVLRPLAELPDVKVVVGTRRSLREGS